MFRYHLKPCFALICSVALLHLTGCQVVNVKQQKIGTTLSNERDNILTKNKLSEASLNVLYMTGKTPEKCISSPQSCIDNLQTITEIKDEQHLSTGSELFLANALQLKNSAACNVSSIAQKFRNETEKATVLNQYDQCLEQQFEALNQSIRYSYAYLFATDQDAQQRLFNNRHVQIRDFYNQAIADLINGYNNQSNPLKKQVKNTLTIGSSNYLLNTELYPGLDQYKTQQIISTYNLTFSGLRSISRRDGFGSEFVIQLRTPEEEKFSEYLSDPFHHYQGIHDHPNIHEAAFLPATIVVEPQQADSIDQILASKNLKLRLIDPSRFSHTMVDDKYLPIAANFSAPYGLWLANNNLGASAYWTLIDREAKLIMPHLFMLEPYSPDKKIIIMIHGLASSPEAWIAMTNDIMGDEILRENFQVWQIFYSTNMPILESRYQIYALLKQTFDDLKRQYPQKAPQDSILLGHSMGGVISRLLVSDDDFTPRLLDSLDTAEKRQYRKIKDIDLATARLKMTALTPEISRAIFVSAPLQGTDFADRWFTLLARKIIKLPAGFLQASTDILRGDISEAADTVTRISKDFLQNGPSDLSKSSAFMKLTAQVTINPKVKYNLIIGNSTPFQDTKLMTDGIVPYRSSYLPNAESEKIISGGHSIQYSPEAVLELRRILRKHLDQLNSK